MDPRAKKAEQVVAAPAGVTILPDELAGSQARLGQQTTGGLAEPPLPAFKVFPSVVNVPTGQEQATLRAERDPFVGQRPDFKPTPGAINVPHGEETVTIRRRR